MNRKENMRSRSGKYFPILGACAWIALVRDTADVYCPYGSTAPRSHKVRFEAFPAGLPGFMQLTLLPQHQGFLRGEFVYNMEKFDDDRLSGKELPQGQYLGRSM